MKPLAIFSDLIPIKKHLPLKHFFSFLNIFFAFNGKLVFSLSLIGAATSDRSDNCLEPFSARLRLLWINRRIASDFAGV